MSVQDEIPQFLGELAAARAKTQRGRGLERSAFPRGKTHVVKGNTHVVKGNIHGVKEKCGQRCLIMFRSKATQGGSEIVQSKSSEALAERELLDRNRSYYDMLWADARLVEPQRFNTWPLVQSLLPTAARRLEVAPGLRPRLPIEGTQFLDISAPALAKLRGRGAQVVLGKVTRLPFADSSFDLVCAFDIIEHVDDDDGALSEVSRIARPGGVILTSMPLHAALWTSFDDFVGHKRRYDPTQLLSKLAGHHLTVERSAVFGMQPRSSRLVDLGMWWLSYNRERAMWWYNRVIMQLGLLLQRRLRLKPGMIATDRVDEILLVCRKQGGGDPRGA